MAKYKNEAELVKAAIKAIKADYPDVWVFKTVGNPYQKIGVPDVLLCVNGRLLGLEFKHQKDHESEYHVLSRVSPQQHAVMDEMQRAGAYVEVVWTVERALGAVRVFHQ